MTEIPTKFSMRELYEEAVTSARVKQENLDAKLERRRIDEPTAGLARISIARMRCIAEYLRDVAKAHGDDADWPEWLQAENARDRRERADAHVTIEKLRAADKVDEKHDEKPQTLPEPQKEEQKQALVVEEKDPLDEW